MLRFPSLFSLVSSIYSSSLVLPQRFPKALGTQPQHCPTKDLLMLTCFVRFTLCLALVLSSFLLFWIWSKGLENKFDAEHRLRLNQIFSHNESDEKADIKQDTKSTTVDEATIGIDDITTLGMDKGATDEETSFPTQLSLRTPEGPVLLPRVSDSCIPGHLPLTRRPKGASVQLLSSSRQREWSTALIYLYGPASIGLTKDCRLPRYSYCRCTSLGRRRHYPDKQVPVSRR